METLLQTALTNLVNAYVSATENPKPNYSFDGQSVSWGEYIKMLADGIEATNKLIAAVAPVEMRTQVY